MGAPVRYVQTAMQDLSAANAEPVFWLIVQLPADICQELAASWFLGPAEAETMTAAQLSVFVSKLIKQLLEVWPEYGAA